MDENVWIFGKLWGHRSYFATWTGIIYHTRALSPPVPCLIGARSPTIRACKVVGAPVDRPDVCSG